jgi:hypothetical protein
LTYLTFFYPTDITGAQYGLMGIGTFGAQTRKNFTFSTSAGSLLQFAADRATTDASAEASFPLIAANVWQCGAVTWDGTNGPKLYHAVVGSNVAEAASYTLQAGGSGTIGDSSAQNLYVGNLGAGTTSIIGHIGVSMAFSRALECEEIGRLYAAVVYRRPCPIPSGNVLLYVPQGATSVEDRSGWSNHGLVTSGSVGPDFPLFRSAADVALPFRLTAPRTTKNTRAWPLGVEVGMNWRGAA